MKRGVVPVEQVDKDGNIVVGLDISLSSSEIYSVLERYFPGIYRDEDNMICGTLGKYKYSIRIKNITYLGIPHPTFKKRIQISDDLQAFYRASITKKYIPLLMGIYTYNDNTVFCDFNIEDYINKKAHNCSAHVYTGDISEATRFSIFQKIDYFKNKITVFSPTGISAFFKDKLAYLETSVVGSMVLPFEKEQTIRETAKSFFVDSTVFPSELLWRIWDFFGKERKCWHGIECYREMLAVNYANRNQPEWAGFYLEYRFGKYITEHNISHLVRYEQDRTKDGIDLDLFFPSIGQYGDLKAHSDHSHAIQGNDWDTVSKVIDSNGHIYYIVCEHSTIKDSECNYEVTQFWNTIQGKSNLMSYSARMKNQVDLKKAFVLDINSNNRNYLTKFKQGVNSDGSLRNPKIMVDMDSIEHFLLASKNLQMENEDGQL